MIVLYILVHSIPLVFEILFLPLFALVLNTVQSIQQSNYPESLFALHYTFVPLILIQFSFVLKNQQIVGHTWHHDSFVGGRATL